MSTNEQECGVCTIKTTQRCSGCHVLPLCGRAHQLLIWPTHKMVCKLGCFRQPPLTKDEQEYDGAKWKEPLDINRTSENVAELTQNSCWTQDAQEVAGLLRTFGRDVSKGDVTLNKMTTFLADACPGPPADRVLGDHRASTLNAYDAGPTYRPFAVIGSLRLSAFRNYQGPPQDLMLRLTDATSPFFSQLLVFTTLRDQQLRGNSGVTTELVGLAYDRLMRVDGSQLHNALRGLAQTATSAFFSRILVEGADEVPGDGVPVIAVANHWSSAVDPAVLSCFYPQKVRLHYWAKSTLFKPGFARNILLAAGNIPVDRNNKDNQKLYSSTFDMLKYGEAVAIFPEGGSYTVPGLGPLKDGASWAALEYAKNIREKGRTLSDGGEVPADPVDVTICVAGISYTDKTKYRSSVVMKFGKSIKVGSYVAEFEKDPKAAVKKLSKDIKDVMLSVTVNAPDWDTLNAAVQARKMLWVNERKLPLSKLRDIGQTLVDFFASPNLSPAAASLKSLLLAYQVSLTETKTTHFTLSGVPLPATLDPSVPHPLPTRLRVLLSLIGSTLSSLVRLPFFILPLLAHLPIYLVGKYSLTFSTLEEDLAQNKIALGLVLGIITYPALFVVAWMLLFMTPLGGVLAFGFVWLFAVYHNTLIDDNYNAAKRLMASWRVLVGIWAPHAKSEAVAVLRKFGVEDKIAGENEIRRVLRLRLEATSALAQLLVEMQEKGSEEEKEMVRRLVEWGAKIPKWQPGPSVSSTALKED
ncbi:glycerol-3-phosphate-acyltransferase [Pseudohyphozyma bogoriensis]|nr:glycerol-3-phosphate-acyltransferase [Pseudohyphozyma bogoriensis]